MYVGPKASQVSKERRKERSVPITMTQWLKDFPRGSLLSRARPLSTSIMLQPSLYHMGLWKTLKIQSTHCWLHPHLPHPLWNTGAPEVPRAHVPIWSTSSSLVSWIHLRQAQWPRKGRALQGKGIKWDMWSKVESWGPQSRRVDQGLCSFGGWKLLKLRVRNPDCNS